MSQSAIPVRRALLSVSDKTGLAPFAQSLAARGIELISTGGTAKALREAGLSVRDVAEVTGAPEMMDGRVKTLHPRIHGGLLAIRDNAEHQAAMAEHGVPAIDLLVVNLYPFEATVAKGAPTAQCVEQIDIGGPAMIRAAAKNHPFVAVVTNPSDYADVLSAIEANDGATDLPLRQRLAGAAFAHTAKYDAAISAWWAQEITQEEFPAHLNFSAAHESTLRYGENPHQSAAFYRGGPARLGVADAQIIQGKPLSYNNLADADAAFELAAELNGFGRPACAIIKHANPCGAASAESLAQAYRRALACDSTSAFGGILAFNQPLDEETAQEAVKIFTEVVIAPGASDAARAIFATKPNLRLLLTQGLPNPAAQGRVIKQIAGGYLVQDRDGGRISTPELKIVTKRAPTEQELADMMFAWSVAKHVKSNAIVYAKDGATVGVGAGQMSRLDSTRIAARKAEDAAQEAGLKESPIIGSAVASDAFFPFADGLVTAAAAGATAVIQPGGSIRDEEVVKAADDAGLAMAFTSMRHFRH